MEAKDGTLAWYAVQHTLQIRHFVVMDFLRSVMAPQAPLSPSFLPGGALEGYNEDAVSLPSRVDWGHWRKVDPPTTTYLCRDPLLATAEQ